MNSKEIAVRVQEIEQGKELGKREDKKPGGMVLAVIIGIIASIGVGVSILPSIQKSLERSGKEEASALTGVMSILFVLVLAVGAVMWIGNSKRDKEEYKEIENLSAEDEIRRLQRRKRRTVIYNG